MLKRVFSKYEKRKHKQKLQKEMKKILKVNAKTTAYVNNLPNLYIVGFWAHYGVMLTSFTGKYTQDKYSERQIPLVYEYNDHNGEHEEYILMPITHVTTGQILLWTDNKDVAQLTANALEFSNVKNKESFDKFRKER